MTKYYIEYFDENNEGFLGSEDPWIETREGYENANNLIKQLKTNGYTNISLIRANKTIKKEKDCNNDFDKILRIEELTGMISEYTKELNELQLYFTNKQKVGKILNKKEKNGNKGLLGLNNKVVYHPTAYCALKQVYLLYDDMREKKCYHKDCKHIVELTEQEKKKGIKKAPVRYFNGKSDCSD